MDKNKNKPAPTQTVVFSCTMYRYDAMAVEHNGICDSLAELKDAILQRGLTDIAKVDVCCIKNDYKIKPARLVAGRVDIETYYIADRVQTLGEFMGEYMLPVCDRDDIDFNSPVVLEYRDALGVLGAAHALDPRRDTVFDRKLNRINYSRGRGE